MEKKTYRIGFTWTFESSTFEIILASRNFIPLLIAVFIADRFAAVQIGIISVGMSIQIVELELGLLTQIALVANVNKCHFGVFIVQANVETTNTVHWRGE